MPDITAVTASFTNTSTKPLRQSNLWDPLLGNSECFMPKSFVSGMFMVRFLSIDQVCWKTPENVKQLRSGTRETWNPSYLCSLNLACVKVWLDMKSSSPAWFLGEQCSALDGRMDSSFTFPWVNRGSTGSTGTPLVPVLVLQLGTTQLARKSRVCHRILGTTGVL